VAASTSPARARGSGQFVGLGSPAALVLDPDPVRAREAARDYRNNLHCLGFSEEDTAGRGSDRLVAHGDATTVAAELAAHFEAGADHVALQVMTRDRVSLPGDDRMIALYRTLAAELH
jgi:hypothetical protein